MKIRRKFRVSKRVTLSSTLRDHFSLSPAKHFRSLQTAWTHHAGCMTSKLSQNIRSTLFVILVSPPTLICQLWQPEAPFRSWSSNAGILVFCTPPWIEKKHTCVEKHFNQILWGIPRQSACLAYHPCRPYKDVSSNQTFWAKTMPKSCTRTSHAFNTSPCMDGH